MGWSLLLSLLLPLMIQLLKWLLSSDDPLKPREEKRLREFLVLAEKVRFRAEARGMKL